MGRRLSDVENAMGITIVRAKNRAWLANSDGGGEFSALRANADGGTVVVRMTEGSRGAPHHHPGGEELIMLTGQMELAGELLGPGDYMWTPPGMSHSAFAVTDCEFMLVLPRRPIWDAKEGDPANRSPGVDMNPVAERLALACRIVAHQSHATGLAGQLTIRDPNDAEIFWTQTYGLAVEEALPANMLRINNEIEVVDGEGMANPANRFHAWVYQARSDVGAIVQTHAPRASALSMLKEPLVLAHMDVMALFGDVAWLPNWPGVPFGDEAGRIITDALGDKSAILLANHGLLTVAATIERATMLAVTFEHAARLQLLARPAGEINQVTPDLGADARDHTRDEAYARAYFRYWTRQLPPEQKPWMQI